MTSTNQWDCSDLLSEIVKNRGGGADECAETTAKSSNDRFNTNVNDNYEQNSSNSSDDFYQLLGISRRAIKSEIKRAYHVKAREVHPDRNTSMSQKDAETAFHDLTFAYKTLMDDKLRDIYDKFGKNALDGKLQIDITKINLMDLFDCLYDENDEKNKSSKPAKLYVVTPYNDNDLRNGWKIVSFDRKVTCEICYGQKMSVYDNNCFNCDGNGFIEKSGTQKVSLKSDNLKDRDIVFDGKGHRLNTYPKNGDLIVRLRYWADTSSSSSKRKHGAGVYDGCKDNNNNIKEKNDEIVINISLRDALFGINNEEFNINVCGPIQSGDKRDINGINITFNVVIPDLTQDMYNNISFRTNMNRLHVSQEKMIYKKNQDSMKKIEQMAKKREYCHIL